MTDLVLPSVAPIEAYVDEMIDVLADILGGSPEDALVGFDFNAQGVWSLARPGAPPIKLGASLADAGVVDGSLLTVVSLSRTERYRPLVEDVIDAIAVLDATPEFNRRALYRLVGLALPLATLIVAAVAIQSWSTTGRSWWWALALGVLGLGLLSGGMFAQSRYRNVDIAECLLISSLVTLGASVTLAVPLPRGVETLGAPQIAGVGSLVLLFVLGTRGGPKQRAEAAAFLAVMSTAVTLAGVAFGYGWGGWVPAGAIAFGLIIVTNSAKLTVAVARIALPPIPAPGETVSNSDLLEPVSATDSSEESETWQAIIASAPGSAARLTERSRLAKRLLIGFLAAGALILAAGAIAVVVQGHFFVHSLIVAGLVMVICGFRSRLYADPWCAWALLAAAVSIPTGLMVRLCLWYPERAWLVMALYGVLVLIAVILMGATDGIRRISPVTKRALELLDGAGIAAMIPMLLWIAGVYDLLRNLRF
ncbi:MAG: type VII secretion integral membrane protein EccD [Actinomycetia bacterium]|nr:type VII secretion integral membrane protein EccD [Actinomycetes bacterium]MCH9709600.1 type VII secretion integral membrane protein EccD [Actinomycetes bacterium]